MRKALGLFFATSLLVSVAAISAAPAGAANTTLPKCKSISGTSTYTPGLPPTSSKATVKPVNKVTFSITGCTGGGITKGSSSGSLKSTTATNCSILFKDVGKPAKPTTGKITWSNGQTSTTSSVLTVTGVKGTALTAKLVSKYTAGLGKGHTSTVLVLANPNKGWCSTAPLSKVTFKSTSITSK